MLQRQQQSRLWAELRLHLPVCSFMLMIHLYSDPHNLTLQKPSHLPRKEMPFNDFFNVNFLT